MYGGGKVIENKGSFPVAEHYAVIRFLGAMTQYICFYTQLELEGWIENNKRETFQIIKSIPIAHEHTIKIKYETELVRD